MDLAQMKQSTSLMDYITSNGYPLKKVGTNTYRLNPCPVCGHKDHFTVYNETNSYSSFGGCCRGGSIIDFMMEVEGMEKQAAISKLKTLAGVEDDAPKDSKPAHKEIDELVKIQTRQLIEKACANDCTYYRNRGLTDKTIKKYNLGYLPEGATHGTSYKYVLPVSDNFVIFRSDKEAGRRYFNQGNTEIFNTRYLCDPSLTGKDIYITEGMFDALSLEEMDLPAIALNSTNMADKLILKIKENIQFLLNKTLVIIMDPDESGKLAADKLEKGLEGLEVPYIILNMTEDYKDINDYYINNKDGLQQEIKDLYFAGTSYEYLGKTFGQEQAKRLGEPEILTGFPSLNEQLGGGLYPGLYVIGSISSLGKTAFVLQISDRIAAQQHPVLFCSLEMSRYEMTCRSLARETLEQTGDKGFSTRNVLKGKYRDVNITAHKPYMDALEAYRNGPGRYMTMIEGNFDISISWVRTEIKKYISRTGQSPVVVIDYLQVLRPINSRMSDKQAIDYNVIELKRISREFDTPVIVISSFNRASYKNKVSFESFKESGSIEFTSDVVLGLQLRLGGDKDIDIDELKNREPRQLEMVILKNRRGKPFQKIDLIYWAKQNFFTEE